MQIFLLEFQFHLIPSLNRLLSLKSHPLLYISPMLPSLTNQSFWQIGSASHQTYYPSRNNDQCLMSNREKIGDPTDHQRWVLIV